MESRRRLGSHRVRRIALRFAVGASIGLVALLALFHSVVAFASVVAFGAGLGGLLSHFSSRENRTEAMLDSAAYALFFLLLPFALGPGEAPPVPFFAIYLSSAAILFAGHTAGRTLASLLPILLAAGLGAGLASEIRWQRAMNSPPVNATRLFVGPTFVTNNPQFPIARAVLVNTDGTIANLYPSRADAPKDVPTVRLPGELAVPGLHDAHLHLNLIGMAAWGVDLTDVTSRKELRATVEAFIQQHPERSYYVGSGWDQERFPDKSYPTVDDLEGLTEKPIGLIRVDQHAALVNRPLLTAMGLDRNTPDPLEGNFVRDETGAPTGILIDAVMVKAQEYLPNPTLTERKWMLGKALSAASRAGLVAVHDMAMDPPTLEALAALQRESPPPIRIFSYIRGDELPWLIAHRLRRPAQSIARTRRGGPTELMGIKLFIDGALGSRGALLFEPYADQPGHVGAPAYDLDLQRTAYRIAEALGYQIAIHAIGDAGIDTALGWVEQHHRDRNLATRIEHAQVIRSADFHRLANPGVFTSMQPHHLIDDMEWVDARIGSERAAGAYAWLRVLDAGATLAFGSDAPVSSIDPTLGFHAALTRQNSAGQPPGGYFPDQRLSFEQTLDAYTRGAARAVGREHEIGSLEVGKQFDLSVFDRDCRDEPSCWLAATATATVVAGRVHEIQPD